MSSGEKNRHVITAGRRDISDQIVRRNHNRITKTTRGDQETNNNQDQDSQETVITVEDQDINRLNVEQGSIH